MGRDKICKYLYTECLQDVNVDKYTAYTESNEAYSMAWYDYLILF